MLTPAELRARRRELRLTQVALGALLGVSANTVARWERGELRVGKPELVRSALERLGGPAVVKEAAPLAHHNLPAELTSFVGRKQELRDVVNLLPTTRLLTLVGAGGVGKTRLALEAAAGLVERYAEGVWLVELAPLGDPALVPQQVALTLGVREEPGCPVLATLAAHLRTKQVLVVLDNCEHLLEACAAVAKHLLRTCPQLRILATSREPLGLLGETTWRVPSLSLPARQSAKLVESLAQSEAAQLLVERARAGLPSWKVTEENAPAVAAVCRRLDGIPLALELAAPRLSVLTVQQLADRLQDRFRLLTGGDRTAPARQQTLRATLDWSYGLLSDPEQRLFERLSLFAGGCTLDAAEAVCASEDVAREEVLDLVARLVAKSLVVADEQHGEMRYRLLESIREYGLEQSGARGALELLRRRHAAFFLDLAERLEPESRGLQSGPWLNRLEADHDNLRAALRWAIDRGQAETALRLTWALGMFWFKGGHWSEARRWLAEALLLDGPVPPAVRARALALDGNFAKHQEDLVAAQGRTEQALALYRQLGDTHAVARTLRNLGEIAAIQGDFARARVLSEECLALARQIRDVELITQCFSNLGLAALFAGDFAQGVPFYEEALRLARQGANTFGIGLNLIYLGQAALWQDEIALARGRFTESLAIWRELGHRDQIALCLNGLGGVAAAERQPGRAARLWGAAEALREALGAMLEPLEKRLLERDIARGRALASRPAFEAAWATGRAMPMEEAIQYVLGSAEPEPVESSAEDLVLLTAREREVVALVAQGLTNPQIARRLVIAESTAERHVSNILGKLALSRRAQLAAWAARHGLAAPPPAR